MRLLRVHGEADEAGLSIVQRVRPVGLIEQAVAMLGEAEVDEVVGATQVHFVLCQLMQGQKGVAVACDAVAEAHSLLQQTAAPHHLAGVDGRLQPLGLAGHRVQARAEEGEAGGAVAPLDQPVVGVAGRGGEVARRLEAERQEMVSGGDDEG